MTGKKEFKLRNLKRELAIVRNDRSSPPLERREKIKYFETRIKLIVPPQYDKPCQYCGCNDPYQLTLHEEFDNKLEKTDTKVTVCEDCHQELHRLQKLICSPGCTGFVKDLARHKLQMMEKR